MSYVLRLYIRDPKLVEIEDSVYKLIEKSISVPKFFYSGSYKDKFNFGILEFIDKKHIFEIVEYYPIIGYKKLISRISLM